MAISCAYNKCKKPVIGQCVGYKIDCRRYYCASHSKERLCYECAERKEKEETEKYIYDTYLQESNKLNSQVNSSGCIPIILGIAGYFVVLYIAAMANGIKGETLLITTILYGVISYVVIKILQNRFKENKLLELEETHPGISKFYKVWKTEKNKEKLMGALSIAGVIAAGAIGMAAADLARETRVNEISEGVRRAK
jgi:hypothetical protein